MTPDFGFLPIPGFWEEPPTYRYVSLGLARKRDSPSCPNGPTPMQPRIHGELQFVVMGVVVLAIVLAILMPIFNLNQLVGR